MKSIWSTFWIVDSFEFRNDEQKLNNQLKTKCGILSLRCVSSFWHSNLIDTNGMIKPNPFLELKNFTRPLYRILDVKTNVSSEEVSVVVACMILSNFFVNEIEDDGTCACSRIFQLFLGRWSWWCHVFMV